MFLEVEDLVKFYGEGENRVKVLKGISTGVEKGETVVLEDREAEQYYAFRVDSIVQYSPNFTVFMDIDEMRKLYLNGNMYFVALGSLIAIPLAKKTIDSIYPYFISNVACAMDLSMSPLVYVGLFAVIMAMYFVINALLVRKIDRVTPAEVLKNRE